MVDKTKHKKWILIFIAVQKIVGGIVMVSTDNYVAHICKGASDGLAEAFISPTVAAMTLGVVGKTRFHKKALAYNEIIKNAGTLLSIVIFGCVAFEVYPHVREVFYQYIIIGVILLATVASMPDENDGVVDHNIAKGKSFVVRKNPIIASMPDENDDVVDHNTGKGTSFVVRANPINKFSNVFAYDAEELHEEDEDDQDDFVEDDALIREPSKRKADKVAHPATSVANAESQQYTKTMTFREMYSDPKRGKSLLFLSLVICTYHLVNATILPLTGQFIGLQTEDRYSLSVFMIFMLVKVGAELLSQWYVVGKMDLWGYRNCMIFACVLLGVRCALFSVVSYFTNKIWLLAIVHATQGPPVALENLTKRLYVHVLSRRTGRYNVNFGTIETFKVVGSALSITVGGLLATTYSYQFTFSVMAVTCIVPIALVFGVNDVTLTTPVIGNIGKD